MRKNQYYNGTLPPLLYNPADGIAVHQRWLRNEITLNDYRIPLLLEIEYPVSKKINIPATLKYNFNPQNGDTYSSGLGLSLKL